MASVAVAGSAMNNLDTGPRTTNRSQPPASLTNCQTDPQTYWLRIEQPRDNIERLLTSDEKFMIFVGARRCAATAVLRYGCRWSSGSAQPGNSFHVGLPQRSGSPCIGFVIACTAMQ